MQPPNSKPFEVRTKNGIVVISIKLGEEAEAFDDTDRIAEHVVNAYREASVLIGKASCVAVIETRVATSQLIRIVFQLYRECQRHHGRLYVCKFPEEYMISLSTLGLTELPGFELAENEDDARMRENDLG
jgi:hypothetical protein